MPSGSKCVSARSERVNKQTSLNHQFLPVVALYVFQVSQENVPAGYEAIPLGEALNGPTPGRQGVQGAEGKTT